MFLKHQSTLYGKSCTLQDILLPTYSREHCSQKHTCPNSSFHSRSLTQQTGFRGRHPCLQRQRTRWDNRYSIFNITQFCRSETRYVAHLWLRYSWCVNAANRYSVTIIRGSPVIAISVKLPHHNYYDAPNKWPCRRTYSPSTSKTTACAEK